jgi:pimeloyl-ACP methyl ester carboxylesterase
VLIILVMVLYPGGLWGLLQEMREAVTTWRTALRARLRRVRGRSAREALPDAPERMIATPHGRIAVSDSGGDKPAIFAIHGNSACKEAFARQAAAFPDTHRIIAFDLPRHGMSDNADPETAHNIAAYADVAKAVPDQSGATRPIVLGWSLGGYVGLELVARAPRDLAGLCITGTAPLNIVPEDFARGYDPSSHLVLAGKQYFTGAEQRTYADSATAPLSPDSAFMHANISRTDGRTRLYMITTLGVVD